jgi:hypothetical protein
MSKIIKLSLSIFVVILIAACAAGRNFVRPKPESLILGKTTYDEIIQRFGKPYTEGTQVKNGITLKTVGYAYSKVGGPALFEGVTPGRGMGFSFLDNVVVGHEFTSSYRDDNSYFDDSKVGQIKKGETTRNKVIELMGRTGGMYVYPLIKGKDEKALVYLYTHTKGSIFDLKVFQKLLVVSFNDTDIVTDINFTSSGQK